MSPFSQDEKWLEAKRAVGHTNWIEVISYYHSIQGSNVSVYSVVEGSKRLIVDIIDDNTVLLIDSNGNEITDTYDNVLKSRKIFKYSEGNERHK